jgi:chromosome segregation ATPase
MTSSDRGLEIQHRLEELKDEFLSDFWCVHGDRCAGECSCEQYAVKHEATIRDAQAEIQRLTGELAQARRELREQDVEADRLTRELIQVQGELAEARAERQAFGLALNDAVSTLTTTWNVAYWEPEKFKPGWFIAKYDAWLKRLANNKHDQQIAEYRALQSSQQGLRAALAYLIGEWRKTGQTERAEWLLCADELEAALAAPGDETPP